MHCSWRFERRLHAFPRNPREWMENRPSHQTVKSLCRFSCSESSFHHLKFDRDFEKYPSYALVLVSLEKHFIKTSHKHFSLFDIYAQYVAEINDPKEPKPNISIRSKSIEWGKDLLRVPCQLIPDTFKPLETSLPSLRSSLWHDRLNSHLKGGTHRPVI